MKSPEFMWSMLIHLGGNMWNEEGNIRGRETNLDAVASSTLRLDRKMWDDYICLLYTSCTGLWPR